MTTESENLSLAIAEAFREEWNLRGIGACVNEIDERLIKAGEYFCEAARTMAEAVRAAMPHTMEAVKALLEFCSQVQDTTKAEHIYRHTKSARIKKKYAKKLGNEYRRRPHRPRETARTE